jgi:hypothetical protein
VIFSVKAVSPLRARCRYRTLFKFLICIYVTFLFYSFCSVIKFIFILLLLLSSSLLGNRVAQSVQCLTTDWTTGRSGIDVRSPTEAKGVFPLTFVSRQAQGSTQPPVQCVPDVLSPGKKRGRSMTLTTYPHLAQRSRMSRGYTSSPPKRFRGVLWDSFSFLVVVVVLILAVVVSRTVVAISSRSASSGSNSGSSSNSSSSRSSCLVF